MKRVYGMMKYLLMLLLVAVGVTSCDVHEFPDTPERVPFTLLLDCKTELPIYQEIYSTKQTANAKAEHDRRYIINVYRSEDSKDFSRQADTTLVVTGRIDEETVSIPLNLPQGFYKFLVWCDHVDKGTVADKYYNTTNFAEITYADRASYEGSNDYKDAFRGSEQTIIHYDQYDDGNIISQVVTMELDRPLAKFKFIATDLEEFVQRERTRLAAKGEKDTMSINPDDYRVVAYYNGFMPCSFNMFTNKPNDSWNGMAFDGKMRSLANGEMELCFDYVMVNGTESKVNVVVEVYYKDGELLSRTRAVDVPLVRSKLTIVRGLFLTSMATGNVGIVTDYDGDINIEIV